MLTRQGWLVGIGAGLLLVAGRVLGLMELFALGVVATALLVGSAVLVHSARLELEVGRVLHPAASTSAPPAEWSWRCATCGAPPPRAPPDRSRVGHPGGRPPAATAGEGRAHRGRLPPADRPPGHRADRPARGGRGRSVRAHDRDHRRRATRAAHRAPPRGRHRRPALHDRSGSAGRRPPAQLAGPHRRGVLRAAALHGGRRPPAHPLADLGPAGRAARPPERAPVAGPHHRAPRRARRRPPRRVARGGRVRGGQHRDGHGAPAGPRAPRHDDGVGLRLRAGHRPRQRHHGAPRRRARRPRRAACAAPSSSSTAGRRAAPSWSSSPRCPRRTCGPSRACGPATGR